MFLWFLSKYSIILLLYNQYLINRNEVMNIAGLKINQDGYGLAVLLIEAPPSIYGIVLWIISSWFGKNCWNWVINIKQAFTATNGMTKIQILMDLTFLTWSIRELFLLILFSSSSFFWAHFPSASVFFRVTHFFLCL